MKVFIITPNLSKDPEIADPIIIEQIFSVIGEEVYRINNVSIQYIKFCRPKFPKFLHHIKSIELTTVFVFIY